MGVLLKNHWYEGAGKPRATTPRDKVGDVPAVVEIEVVLKMELSGIKDWG